MDVILGCDIKIYETTNIYGKGRIGSRTKIANFVEIGDPDIGEECKIEAFVYIPPGVHISNNVFIGPHVCFTNDKHPSAGETWEKLETFIFDRVSIGANATILPGITIGQGAVIGAGAVVTKNVVAWSTVIGNPARSVSK
jgi:acetyltransferase-like isoleucine patch superfamily enzyme